MGKPKGFGYVEFPSQDKLKDALARSMTQMGGRTLRISVAEPRESHLDPGDRPDCHSGIHPERRVRTFGGG